jgi:hypothetical protein
VSRSVSSPAFSVGDVLAGAWDLFTRNSWRLILMAAVVFGLLSLLYVAVDASESRVLLPLSAGVTILGVLSLQGALTLLVADLRSGRPARRFGDLYGALGPRLWTLLGAEVLATIGIVGGFILFIVPGVVLLTLWSCLIPAILIEGRGILESFRRSQYLVAGNVLKTLVVVVLTVLLATVVASVITIALAPLPRFVDVYVAGVIANSVTMPYVAVAWTVMFFELRRAKEGAE